MHLADTELVTPALVLDRRKFERNAARFKQRYAGAVSLRPHLKTVKSIEAAATLLPTAQGPATVSTLREAEVFGASGVTDLLYAVGLTPQKIPRVMRLRERGIDLKVITDNVLTARAVALQAKDQGQPIPTLIELDVDGHRSGIRPDDEPLLQAVASVLSEQRCFAGVMTHAGGSYRARSPDALAQAAAAERDKTVGASRWLESQGFPSTHVSVGSTPTAANLTGTDGLTEVRAGVYAFFDLFQHGAGVCELADIALSVLTTVIGHQRRAGWIITDAGWMALSQDRSTASQPVDQGYGLVCDLEGNPIESLQVISANQEHGVLAVRPGSSVSLPDLPVGTRLRILPNHACATAAQHEGYQVLGEDLRILAAWPRIRGW